MSERWAVVDGFPDYDVSDLGRVRSRRQPGRLRILKQGRNPKGYLFVALQDPSGQQRSKTVHRLVGHAFLGPLPTGLVTRHLDGNQLNNVLSNLAYGTPSENCLDSVAHGTHAMASKSHCPAGHAYNAANTRQYRGRRYCIACQEIFNRNRDRRRNAA